MPSIERALTVMEFLAQSNRGFSISEMSRRLAIPKSSIHLILGTLERRGFLKKNAENGRYCFGLGLVGLSRSALENLDLREEARPWLRALMQKTGLTVHMAVLERNEAVIIEKIEAPGSQRLASWVGRRMDVNCTAVGKALLSCVPESEFDQVVKTKSFARHNGRTVISIAALRQEISRIQRLGYAFDDEEDEIGIRCIGAPVFDQNEKAVAAISIAGTTGQVQYERVTDLGNLVNGVARKISFHLAKLSKPFLQVGHIPAPSSDAQTFQASKQ